MMMAMMAGLLDTCLHILLRSGFDVGDVLLRTLQISRLQILAQLVKRLNEWVGAARRGSRRSRPAGCACRCCPRSARRIRYPRAGRHASQAHARNVLSQRSEILLGLSQVAGLHILSQLLKFPGKLLYLGLAAMLVRT